MLLPLPHSTFLALILFLRVFACSATARSVLGTSGIPISRSPWPKPTLSHQLHPRADIGWEPHQLAVVYYDRFQYTYDYQHTVTIILDLSLSRYVLRTYGDEIERWFADNWSERVFATLRSKYSGAMRRILVTKVRLKEDGSQDRVAVVIRDIYAGTTPIAWDTASVEVANLIQGYVDRQKVEMIPVDDPLELLDLPSLQRLEDVTPSADVTRSHGYVFFYPRSNDEAPDTFALVLDRKLSESIIKDDATGQKWWFDDFDQTVAQFLATRFEISVNNVHTGATRMTLQTRMNHPQENSPVPTEERIGIAVRIWHRKPNDVVVKVGDQQVRYQRYMITVIRDVVRKLQRYDSVAKVGLQSTDMQKWLTQVPPLEWPKWMDNVQWDSRMHAVTPHGTSPNNPSEPVLGVSDSAPSDLPTDTDLPVLYHDHGPRDPHMIYQYTMSIVFSRKLSAEIVGRSDEAPQKLRHWWDTEWAQKNEHNSGSQLPAEILSGRLGIPEASIRLDSLGGIATDENIQIRLTYTELKSSSSDLDDSTNTPENRVVMAIRIKPGSTPPHPNTILEAGREVATVVHKQEGLVGHSVEMRPANDPLQWAHLRRRPYLEDYTPANNADQPSQNDGAYVYYQKDDMLEVQQGVRGYDEFSVVLDQGLTKAIVDQYRNNIWTWWERHDVAVAYSLASLYGVPANDVQIGLTRVKVRVETSSERNVVEHVRIGIAIRIPNPRSGGDEVVHGIQDQKPNPKLEKVAGAIGQLVDEVQREEEHSGHVTVKGVEDPFRWMENVNPPLSDK